MAEIRKSFWLISISAACWTAWCRIDSIKFKPTASFWRPPPYGCLKFNECGMANEDRAGCEGALRDKEGVVRALFFGSAAANDFDVAEIGAVKVALDVFLALNWKLNDSLYIELGSIVVFFWCANKSLRPWSLQAIFAGIESVGVITEVNRLG
ncbi:hypothetical protein Golob_004967 [Gossypium lobatum]|uniref:RNase H type-1 domain-containing protein n=1 Tax=Gossypium lobatum TaxID=34289 RepID=A0A7J8N3I1_9ROSI|nr:hypothetical protein [Gossypium lobatum]